MDAYQQLLTKLHIDYAHPGGKKITEKWISKMDLSQMSDILEVGCGVGHTIKHLRSYTPATIHGIDNSPEMVYHARKATKNLKKVHIIQADSKSLPYKTESFDLLIAESVLTFTTINHSLREMTRLLKPGGYLILLEMTSGEALPSNGQDRIEKFYHLPNLYSLADWKKSLLDHQYEYVEYYPVDKQSNSIHINQPLDEELLSTLHEHYHLNHQYQDHLLAFLFVAKKRGIQHVYT